MAGNLPKNPWPEQEAAALHFFLGRRLASPGDYRPHRRVQKLYHTADYKQQPSPAGVLVADRWETPHK